MHEVLAVLTFIVVAFIVVMLAAVLGALCTLLQSIARHRDAQADSVLHHAGLLDREET